MLDQIPDYDSQDFTINEKHEDLLERKIISRKIGSGSLGVDLGGGYGRLTNVLTERFKNVILMDYSVRNLHRARLLLRGKNVIFVKCDIRNPPLEPSSVDGAISIRVMHHYSDLSFIKNIYEKINGGGTLIFNVNNLKSPIHFFNLIKSPISRRVAINPFHAGQQKVCNGSENKCIYFIDYRDVLKLQRSENFEYEVLGCGILHNRFVENKSRLADLERITDAELSPIVTNMPTFLFPDVFFIARSKGYRYDIGKSDPFTVMKCKKCSSHLLRDGRKVYCSGCGENYGDEGDIIDLT
ncbi:MAG: class I SAM-dependent methyltransferase [Thermoplasmatales archaeon]